MTGHRRIATWCAVAAMMAAHGACAPHSGNDARGSRLADELRADEEEYARVLSAEDARAATPAQLQTLLRATQSGSPFLRTVAARALGRLEQPALTDSLYTLLHDVDAGVRRAAAHAIAQAVHGRDAPGVAERLLRALDEQGGDAAAVALLAEPLGRVRHGDRAQSAAILQRLAPHLNGAPDVQLAALRGMYFTTRQGARQAFDPATIAALRQVAVTRGNDATAAARSRSRSLALATLAGIGGVDEQTLAVALQDPVPLVRRDAAAMLQILADTGAALRLLRTAAADSAAMVRVESVRVYARRFAAAHGCAPLIAAAQDRNTTVALMAIDPMGTCRDARAVTLLDSLASSLANATPTTWQRAAHALRALANADTARARMRLAPFASHESFFVRTYSAHAAAALRDDASLRRLAADAHANVRTVAVQGLARVAGHDADAVYVAQLRENDSELLQAAATALEKSADANAALALMAALERVTALQQETSRDARVALLDRLQELGTRALATRMEAFARDFDEVVAGKAADIVQAWTGTRPAVQPQRLPRLPLPSFAELTALESAQVTIDMEDGSTISMQLHPFDAPTNAARFARLAQRGYFDGLTMHRIAPNFVVQGGSPGANEYSGDSSFTRDELGLPNWRGTVGLSTRGRDTGDAQFYINLIDNVRLDTDYTVFGTVTAGMDVVDALQEGARIRRIRIRQ